MILMNPLKGLGILKGLRNPKALIPRSQAQLESELKYLLKLVFWVALLAPVVLVPIYYLLVAFGLAPPIRLPPG